MPFHWSFRGLPALLLYIAKWILLGGTVGVLTGSACALFLWSLDLVTMTRFEQPWLIFLLPLAGVIVGLIYARFGQGVEGGNNLIMEEIHEPGGGVPWKMAPLVLIGTLVTHLFGGSAGREGTAVQMGGSLAGGLSRLLPGLSRDNVRILLTTGVAAGFAGVFGTPVAGTIFALEVLVIGRMTSTALIPCLIAAIVSDQICLTWGIGHTHYQVASMLPPGSPSHLAPLHPMMIFKVVLASVAFGMVSYLFAELTHGLHAVFRKTISWGLARPAMGGVIVILMMSVLGTRDYLGLGVTSPDPAAVTIVGSFQAGGAQPWSWLGKLVFTAVTLASGFKGGEVTPLFFIGATLGNTLSEILAAPVDLFAALGFIAVFAGATNTPMACTMMGVELFGGEYVVYFAIACSVAFLCSGHSGIYLSQRVWRPLQSRTGDRPTETVQEIRRENRSGVEPASGDPLNGPDLPEASS